MTGEEIFSRYCPLVQDYIYANGWRELRPVQIAAGDVLFGTEDNLILSSDTASGKTEAAFFPIITDLTENPSSSVGVLYIAPLKSLINDQFQRLDALLFDSGLPVFHWHGDVAQSHKNKMLNDPKGVLQITPESLESMLINRGADIIRIFGGLRYVIIDEIHTLMSADRGNQVICQLDRLERIIGFSPRRIGLSATIGDMESAKRWLRGNSRRDVRAPVTSGGKSKIKLALQHFYIQDETTDSGENPAESPEKKVSVDAGYEYIYDCSRTQKSIIFSNSREETEYICATMHQLCALRGDNDIFFIHHGNLSASIREEAEDRLKSDLPCVACATVTMELGIDIGRLERVVQLGSPSKVSSFLQRLGRSGRRDAPPEMFMVFREENPLPDTPLPQLIPWDMLRGIAVIQLYIDEKFVEPQYVKKLPVSLLFQQTLSVLASSGALTPKSLAERVLSLSPFADVEKEDYRSLLVHMIKKDYLALCDDGTLIVGLAGEKLLKSFKFYAVFKDSEDYSVKSGSDEIGTISSPVPVGDRFALAGRVWEVEELDLARKLIFVHSVPGKMEISWPGDYGEVHTKVLLKMFEILCSDRDFPYLKDNARKRLAAARRVAENAKIKSDRLISLGGSTKCLFPWLGTRSFSTLVRILKKHSGELGIRSVEHNGCYYITFKSERDCADLSAQISSLLNDDIDTMSLVGKGELPISEKYDACVEPNLLRKAFAIDRLRTDELTFL